MNYKEDIERVTKRDYTDTYKPDNRNIQEILLLDRIYRDKGKPWLIVAMIEGSIGYHSAKHAEMIIDALLKNEYAGGGERCMACYQCDVVKMVFLDIQKMIDIESSDPKSRSYIKIKAMIENISKLLEMDTIQAMTFSAMYPTS